MDIELNYHKLKCVSDLDIWIRIHSSLMMRLRDMKMLSQQSHL